LLLLMNFAFHVSCFFQTLDLEISKRSGNNENFDQINSYKNLRIT